MNQVTRNIITRQIPIAIQYYIDIGIAEKGLNLTKCLWQSKILIYACSFSQQKFHTRNNLLVSFPSITDVSNTHHYTSSAQTRPPTSNSKTCSPDDHPDLYSNSVDVSQIGTYSLNGQNGSLIQNALPLGTSASTLIAPYTNSNYNGVEVVNPVIGVSKFSPTPVDYLSSMYNKVRYDHLSYRDHLKYVVDSYNPDFARSTTPPLDFKRDDELTENYEKLRDNINKKGSQRTGYGIVASR